MESVWGGGGGGGSESCCASAQIENWEVIIRSIIAMRTEQLSRDGLDVCLSYSRAVAVSSCMTLRSSMSRNELHWPNEYQKL